MNCAHSSSMSMSGFVPQTALAFLVTLLFFEPGFAQGSFSPAASMSEGRAYVALVRLLDGRVLAVGGGEDLHTTEIYDPATGKWTAAASMADTRSYGHISVLLKNGKALAAAGHLEGASTAEIYDTITR